MDLYTMFGYDKGHDPFAAMNVTAEQARDRRGEEPDRVLPGTSLEPVPEQWRHENLQVGQREKAAT